MGKIYKSSHHEQMPIISNQFSMSDVPTDIFNLIHQFEGEKECNFLIGVYFCLAEDPIKNSGRINVLISSIVNTFSKAEIFHGIGKIVYSKGDLTAVKSFLEHAKTSLIKLGKENLDKEVARTSLNRLDFLYKAVQAYAYLGDFESVSRICRKSYAESTQSFREVALNFIANRNLGVAKKNLENAGKIIGMVRSCSNRSELLRQMAHACKDKNYLKKIKEILQVTENELNKEPNLFYKVKVLINIAAVRIELKITGSAKVALLNAKNALNQVGFDDHKIDPLIEIASLYSKLHETKKTEEIIQEIKNMINVMGNPYHKYNNLSKLVKFYLEQGDLDNATRCANECAPYMEEADDLEVFEGIFMAYIECGNKNKAREILQIVEELNSRMTREDESSNFFDELMVNFYCKLGDIQSVQRIVENFPENERDSIFIKIEIESGNLASAEKIASGNDNNLKAVALAYSEVLNFSSSRRVADRISNYHLKFSIFRTIALATIKQGNKEEVLKATQDLEKSVHFEKQKALRATHALGGVVLHFDSEFKEVCLSYIELNMPEEAERVANEISSKEVKSSCLAKIISSYIKRQKIKEAVELAGAIPDLIKQCEAFYYIINFIDAFSLEVDEAVVANRIANERAKLAALAPQIIQANSLTRD